MGNRYYCAAVGGFYDTDIHGARTNFEPDPAWAAPEGETDPQPPLIEVANPACLIPADAVEITPELHKQLLEGQRLGMSIVGDEAGNPVLVDPRSLLTLDGLKVLRWQAVKGLRDQHIDGGCEVPGIGRFDTDGPSRANITGAVTGAFMAKYAGGAFAINWKLADNGLIQLDADQMILVGETVLVHVSTCHARSQALGLAIGAATTKEELEAIDINQGWPS